jgi:DNA-binding NtrC family response regulator
MIDSSIVVVDDEKAILFNIKEYFKDSTITMFSNPQEALQWFKDGNRCDILIVDYRMPGLTGLELLQQASSFACWEYSILLTAYADKAILEEAINKNLIHCVLEKPIKMKGLQKILQNASEHVAEVVKNREEGKLLAARYDDLRQQSLSSRRIIGFNKGLKEVYEKIQSVSKHDIGVLITGETGTGKEMVAETVHNMSLRANGPMIRINCAAIPDNLLESELFGYVKGTFTDATKDKPGKIELADGGTLFLDEVGEIPLDTQVKLLRVLQDHIVERVGSTTGKNVNFRLIAATNRDLHQSVADGTFREDLYYRINTFPVELPPLRERKGDINELLEHFVTRAIHEMNLPPKQVDKSIHLLLSRYDWPGNIRELENAVFRAVILAGDSTVLNDVHFSFLEKNPRADCDCNEDIYRKLASLCINENLTLKEIKKNVLLEIVKQCGDSVQSATEKTGISKDVFYRNM